MFVSRSAPGAGKQLLLVAGATPAVGADRALGLAVVLPRIRGRLDLGGRLAVGEVVQAAGGAGRVGGAGGAVVPDHGRVVRVVDLVRRALHVAGESRACSGASKGGD